MFSKNQKITKKEDFNLIYKKGSTLKYKYFKIFILTNSLDFNRFSIIVSKNVSPKAVIRNTIKRRFKNALFNIYPKKEHFSDILIKTYKGVENLKQKDIINILNTLLKSY